MKLFVAIGICLTSLLLGLAHGIAAEIPREPSDRLWEEHMLTGTGAGYLDGKRDGFVPTKPPDLTSGSPVVANYTTRGISVRDLRGTALLGLLTGGGWTLEGGLIGQVERPTSTLELYAKNVWKFYPGFLGMHYSKFKEEQTYEFFLLVREHGASRATILKKWVIQPSEVSWFVKGREHETDIPEHIKQNETHDVRGFLKYLPESQEAEVTITGLTHPFAERVKVELK
jgi:hypothetical protein